MNVNIETPLEIAKYFAKSKLNEGYEFIALHEYKDSHDEIIYYRIRCKHPDGNKWIRPMYQDLDDNKYYLKEPPTFAEKLKPLYGLNLLTKYSDATVVIVEGEYPADRLNIFFEAENMLVQFVAITSGSVTSSDRADWGVLSNRKCLIWPDNDVPGIEYAQKALNILNKLNCVVEILDLQDFCMPEHADCVDWLDSNKNYTIKDFLCIPYIKCVHQPCSNPQDQKPKKQKRRQGQATEIINFVNQNMVLFYDKNKEVFAVDQITNEVYRIISTQFKELIMAKFFDLYDESINGQCFKDALSNLLGTVKMKGECKAVYHRIGKYENCYYLDLCWQKNNKAIKIVPGEWNIVEQSPVIFFRSKTMQALPEPKNNGDLDLLWQCCNIPENYRVLILTWLLDAIRPDTPYPILELIGEQGSAKSTTQTILRRIIDPNACDLRAAPHKEDDLYVTAWVNHIVSCENISYLSPQMQDALCVISTGGGYQKRKLFSDAEEVILYAYNPVIINGISAVITNQDLIDRAITIELPNITKRIDITKIRELVEENSGLVLGAVLDIFVKALAILPSIKLPTNENPRLIEFVTLGTAVAEVIGLSGEEFIKQFKGLRQEAIARTIDASPIANALIEWFEKKEPMLPVELQVKLLFDEVAQYRSNNTDLWPKSAKGFADALRRIAPALRQYAGIDCKYIGKRGSNVYWRISKKENI